MHVISLNVGGPRTVQWHGRTVRTSIWKSPITGRARVSTLNIAGDQQSDLAVDGGPQKAVYAYPSEHYEYWRQKLPGADLSWGAFGENLSTEGLNEVTVHIGDRFQIGSAEFQVTQPRMPCYKLGIRFNDDLMVKRFLESGRSGIYFSVLREGEVGAGDAITLVDHIEDGVSVSDIVSLYVGDLDDEELLRRAAIAPALPDHWKEIFQDRLDGRASS